MSKKNKKRIIAALYALSIVVGVVSSFLIINNRSLSINGLGPCPTIVTPSCKISNPNCTLNYQREAKPGEKGTDLKWTTNIIGCNEPQFPACIHPERPAYTPDPSCNE